MTLKRIYLVGLPGAGKSTVGKFISKELDWKFIDLDSQIEQQEKRKISKIFKQDGEEVFRKIEAETLRSIDQSKIVVATGGGTSCFNDNMNWMNEQGFSVFLNPEKEILIERLKNATHRPLIGHDAEKAISELMDKRMSFYREAKMESSRTDPCEIMAELRKFL